ncbi:hypothetical protein DSM03_106176 [Leeuwenhoekiella aestuarii]|uniref:N-acetyltransferase domain-containing protein n=2 Tax=Leeuwenhoekiella TaxID=283735 RepID=A0A4Q0NSF5_9FLAO|nr:hypothetical protein DSM04_107177 [Leeuwenhoekiella aestuarii]RXG13838.1 hypothetical protein DSM03_106176 [Leeuwenhoekiella aestuarii]
MGQAHRYLNKTVLEFEESLGSVNSRLSRKETKVMDYTIQHRENDKRGMFWIEGENGKISELTYTVKDDSTIIVDHTETKMEFEHQGFASKILDHAVQWARSKAIKIEPLCPFAEVKFDENPEYADVRA